MIFSTLLQPPRAPSEDDTSGRGGHSTLGTLSASRQRARRYRRAVSFGLIASVLLHLLFVRLSPLVVRYIEPDPSYRAPRPRAQVPEGMRVVELQITETPVEQPQPVPEPEPPPEQPEAEAAEGVADRPLTPAERLRPRVGDWRLWLAVPLARRTDLTPEEKAAELERRLHAMLEQYDDSMAAELMRQAESMDWTVGEDGNKWGVSPGQIHLGPITLPLPLYLGPGRESEQMLGDYEAIRRQAGQAEIDETVEERIKAIERERKAKEEARKKAKNDTTSNR